MTLLQGKAYTVNESGEPAGWQDDGSLGYPKNDAGGGATANVPGDNNNFKVTFSNRTVDRKVDVQVCKAVIPNNDNLVDGGQFKFTLSQANATDQTFTDHPRRGRQRLVVRDTIGPRERRVDRDGARAIAPATAASPARGPATTPPTRRTRRTAPSRIPWRAWAPPTPS